MDTSAFKSMIWDYYANNRRHFPWREHISFYRVVVSEIMLQQTQTSRVLQKFEPFVERFSDFSALATASLHDVLSMWKGLGYNRRALALKKTAERMMEHHQHILLDSPELLMSFPGIGRNTACSIVAFAYNKPVVFIETNIRTVFIHCFFGDRQAIHDRDILPLVSASLDHENTRNWYYALMDYGVMLKKTVGNSSRKSAHYHRQSQFVGSDRQIRGQILENLLKHKELARQELSLMVAHDPERTQRIVNDLCTEGMLKDTAGILRICD